MTEGVKMLWRDRKRNFLGLPWTFTVYELNEEFLRIQRGLVNTQYDRVNLYRITDITVSRSIWQKVIGTGTLTVDSDDKTMGKFKILNVKQPMDIERVLSKYVEKARRENRVYMREGLDGGSDEEE